MPGSEEIASYIPQTEPIINYSETGSIHIQYSDIPQPYKSWVWKESGLGGYWDSPVECPADGHRYYWDEDTLSWIQDDV